MAEYYKGQNAVRIELDCETDLSAITNAYIYYRKPSGTESYWTATVSNATEGIIYYDMLSGESFDEAGTGMAKIVYADARIGYGTTVTQYVSEL